MKYGIILIVIAMMISGCSNISPNSARMVELDQAGQIMPGVPAIEGGCVIEAGDNYLINTILFEDGNCSVELSSKGAVSTGEAGYSITGPGVGSDEPLEGWRRGNVDNYFSQHEESLDNLK